MRLYELRFKCIETFPIAEMENYNKFTIDDWKNPGLSLETFLYLYFDHHLILLCTFSQADSDNKLRPEDQLTSGSCRGQDQSQHPPQSGEITGNTQDNETRQGFSRVQVATCLMTTGCSYVSEVSVP